jgi:septal ring factor EnvC (AmiA/AmiB activator)
MRIQGLFILLMLTFSLSAQQKLSRTNELENQRKELFAEIEKGNLLLNENKKSVSSILNNLSLIVQQIDTRKKLVSVLEKEINSLDKEILLKESEIKQMDKEIKLKKSNYALSVQKMYQQKNNQAQLLFVLSADNLAQSFRRMLYLKEYAVWRKQQADEIVSQQKKITIEKETLLVKKQSKKDLADTKRIEESQLHKEENAKKIEVDGLKKDAKKIQTEIDKKKKQAAALDKEIAKIIADEIAKANKAAKSEPNTQRKAETAGGYAMTKSEQALSSDFAKNKGKLPFPLKGSYRIVGGFGEQQFGGLKNISYNSNGIDIKTTPGNNAKAVFDGKVSMVVMTPGLPLTVIIRHGNYLTVYAGLEQLYVKQGDNVKTGQDIGKIYSDRGANDETVLHFELWKEQTKQNPELWLIH